MTRATKSRRKVRQSPPRSDAEAASAHAGAARAARHLQIRSVRFLDLAARSWPDVVTTGKQEIRAAAGFTRPRADERDDAVVITTIFRLRLELEGAAAETPPVARVSAVTQLVYAREPGATIEAADLDDFAAVNAPFNAWPYWREFVQSSLTRLGLPPLPLPLFRIENAASLLLAEDELT